MPEIILYRWYLPPRFGKGKPYLSTDHMDAETAAKRGAIRPEPTSRMVVRTEEDQDINGSFSHLGRGAKEP
jgi:hypothetical protein